MTPRSIEPDETFAEPASPEQLDRAVSALRENGYLVYVADTVAEARTLVAGLLPRDQTIFTASSETLRLSGIADDIDKSGDFASVRARAGDPGDDIDARIRLGATPDVVVGSAHAVTEDGYLLAASATGSQLAPYASGARKAIWIVGAHKVVPDLQVALRRLYSYSLPRLARRLAKSGHQSFIGKILIMQREALPERGTVILVNDVIGY